MIRKGAMRNLEFMKAILFDLDGTLVNTSPLLVATLEQVIEDFGEKVAVDVLEKMIAEKAPLLILKDCFPEFPEKQLKEKYWKYYNKNIDSNIKKDLNSIAVIKELKKRGYELGIVTSLAAHYAYRILELSGLRKYFPDSNIITFHHTVFHKPHPEPINKAMARLRVSKDQTLYIGESSENIVSGKRAGVTTVAALWGAKTAKKKEKLLRQGAAYVLESLSDLLQILS